MRQPICAIFNVFAALALAAPFTTPGAAQNVAEFYKDKTVAIVMGTGPGGSYDLYGRTIARHVSRHIPGNPIIIVEHMPGAGGVIAANHVYGRAPQDGSKILLTHAITMAEKLEPEQGIRFESRKFQWLGAYDAIAQAMTLWHTAPAQTLAEFKRKSFVIGTLNKAHHTYHWAMLAKTVLGANYKIVTGYRSGNELNLAMERGEIHGWTPPWENLAGTRPQWLAENKVTTLVAFTLERMLELPHVPTLLELTPPDQKEVVEFITAGTPMARAMTVGPGVPPDRVAALRKAFDDLMRDEAFLADAEKHKLNIHPRNAAAVHALVDKIVLAAPDLVARARKAIGQGD